MKLKLDLVIHKRARDEEKKKEEGSEVGQACGEMGCGVTKDLKEKRKLATCRGGVTLSLREQRGVRRVQKNNKCLPHYSHPIHESKAHYPPTLMGQ